MTSKRFTCDAVRCKDGATWHGFGGRSHFCDRHKPAALSERRPVESPDDRGWLEIRPKRKG